jgi:hypothetical protein
LQRSKNAIVHANFIADLTRFLFFDLQQDPLVTDTRAADFLRAGRPDPKDKVAMLDNQPKV